MFVIWFLAAISSMSLIEVGVAVRPTKSPWNFQARYEAPSLPRPVVTTAETFSS